jgi:hypothetical protein
MYFPVTAQGPEGAAAEIAEETAIELEKDLQPLGPTFGSGVPSSRMARTIDSRHIGKADLRRGIFFGEC